MHSRPAHQAARSSCPDPAYRAYARCRSAIDSSTLASHQAASAYPSRSSGLRVEGSRRSSSSHASAHDSRVRASLARSMSATRSGTP